MEGQTDMIGQQYEELMKKYNQIKIDIKNANEKKNKMAEIDAEIQRINEEIKLSQIKAETADLDINKPDERIRELQRLIQEEDNNHKLIEANNKAEIASLEQELNSKNQLLTAHHEWNVEESAILSSISSNQQAIVLQKQLEQLLKQVQFLSDENQNLESKYQELQNQTKQKQIQYKNTVESSLQNQQIQKEKTAQIENFEKQLKLLNEQYEILKKTLETQQLKHALKAEENKRKNEDYNRQLEDLEQLRDKLKREIQIKQKQRSLQRDKLINENNKLNQQKQTIVNMEKQYNLLQKHSVELDKNITELRKKVKDMKEQEKLQKPKKNETNFKLEMNSLEIKIKTLEEQIDRERKKYNEIIKMKSTYVSQSELAKLQDDYNKLIVNVKPVEGESKKNLRLKQDNKLLKERVEYLKKADQQSIRDKKNLINEIKAKNQNLIEHKQFYEKQIQHNQSKLNDYTKEYPNHEHDKEERKKAKKHNKQQNQEEKVSAAVSVQESKPVQVGESEQVKSKKRRIRNKGKHSSEDTEEESLFDETIIPQPTDKVSQIYKNKNVQLAILGAVIILGLLLFSSLN